MTVAGVITEYNPFHAGHELHIKNSRKLTGADYLIVIMSGSFVQRGEPAVMDKYLRTEIALRAGADLVIELPAPFSCASAQYFAYSSIALLDKLHTADFLVFGSECGDADKLSKAASYFMNEPASFKSRLNEAVKNGLSYPAAVNKAFSDEESMSDISDLILSPNNMLGIEYIKALLSRCSDIRPVTYKRSGDYNSTSLSAGFPSASAIRIELFNSQNSKRFPDVLLDAIPEYAEDIMVKNYNKSYPVSIDDFSLQLTYRILSLGKNELNCFSDVSSDMGRRIVRAASEYFSCSEIIDSVKTKAFTRARISRALMHILLNIKDSEMEAYKKRDYLSYARILGFRKEASPLLNELKKNSEIPLISKLAGYNTRLDKNDTDILDKEIFASTLYHSAVSYKYKTPPVNEFTKGVIII